MELNLEDFVHVARALSIEDLFSVASNLMQADHLLWFGNELEEVAI